VLQFSQVLQIWLQTYFSSAGWIQQWGFILRERQQSTTIPLTIVVVTASLVCSWIQQLTLVPFIWTICCTCSRKTKCFQTWNSHQRTKTWWRQWHPSGLTLPAQGIQHPIGIPFLHLMCSTTFISPEMGCSQVKGYSKNEVYFWKLCLS